MNQYFKKWDTESFTVDELVEIGEAVIEGLDLMDSAHANQSEDEKGDKND